MVNAILQEYIALCLKTLGIDLASFKILLCTLLSFPFSVVFKRLPDANYTLKNLYVISVSSFYVFGILELTTGLVTLLISSLGCYFITRYLRTKSMPWINFLFLMLHLAYSHVHTQFFKVYDPTIIDITGAQMVLVMKLSAFGWNIHDGKQPKDTVTPYGRSRIIKKHPNILPYLGFVFFYASVLTGPAFDYVDYDKFIHSTLFDDVPETKRPGKRKRRIPRSGIPALKKVLQGSFWASIYFIAPKFVSLNYVLSGDLMNHNFIYRIFYLWGLGLFHRLRYYTVWLIAEGACILCGIGYNGYDQETDQFKWNRVQNIDPYSFETGQNVHTCLEAWNMNTNKWLKNYVYLRLAKKGKKPGFKSTLFTFATSAFWHGTRPGYYLTFVLGAFLQTIGKLYRRNLRPIFLEKDGVTPKSTKKYYDIVSFFVTQLAFGFACQPFVILDLKKSLYCWSTVYFYVPILTLATLAAFMGPFGKQVTLWCRSHQDSFPSDSRVKNVLPPTNKLSEKEAAIVESAVVNMLNKDEFEGDIPTLGLPSIDVLQEASKQEFDDDMKEFSQAWTSFRGRRGSIKDDDFEGLRDAYKNFTSEINDIFNSQKESITSINKKK